MEENLSGMFNDTRSNPKVRAPFEATLGKILAIATVLTCLFVLIHSDNSTAAPSNVSTGETPLPPDTPKTTNFVFHESAAERGVIDVPPVTGFASGVAAADFDNDGDIDLYVPTREDAPGRLFRNRGDGVFDEVAREVGLLDTARRRAALWIDVDGDGLLDLLTAGDCFQREPVFCRNAWLSLYRQTDAGQFVDATEEAALADLPPLNPGVHLGGVAAGDVTGDGWLDIVVGFWGDGGILLLVNDGSSRLDDGRDDSTGETPVPPAAHPGRFSVRTLEAGLPQTGLDHWQPVLFDVDRDGDLDFFSPVDFLPNRLWINDGVGRFHDIAPEAGVATAWNDMGVAVGDPNNDGRLDLFVTEITELTMHNTLHLRAPGDRVFFHEVATETGVAEGGFSWGADWLDADNDGWMDLAVTNGWFNGFGVTDPSRFFRNTGSSPLRFDDVSEAVAFDDMRWGSALVAADLDRDGDPDLVQRMMTAPMRVLENVRLPEAPPANWLVIKPRMRVANRYAIGAEVRAEIGGRIQTRLIAAGGGMLSQSPAEAPFGLGDARSAEIVTITWPGGETTVLRNVPANRTITIVDGPCCDAGDFNFDGSVDGVDLAMLLADWGACDAFHDGRDARPTCLRQGDMNGDGHVDGLDLALLLGQWG